MQLAMVGLGRMGANLVRRLMADGHDCVVFDTDPKAVGELAQDGAVGCQSLDDMITKLQQPRAVWIMVPAGDPTDAVVTALSERLDPGDTIIDGGNSYYRDDIVRAAALAEKDIHYLDVGTSGGVWGRDRGYCLMIGGDAPTVRMPRPRPWPSPRTTDMTSTFWRSPRCGAAAASSRPGCSI